MSPSLLAEVRVVLLMFPGFTIGFVSINLDNMYIYIDYCLIRFAAFEYTYYTYMYMYISVCVS